MSKRKTSNDNQKIFLSRDQILATELRTKDIYIEAWQSWVRIQELTAKEIEDVNASMLRKNGKPDLGQAAKIPLQMCLKKVVDENGERIFKNSDLPALERKHAHAVNQIADEVSALSGLVTDENKFIEWVDENYPQVLREYQERYGAVAEAKENFF